jgi:hypothetical protein
MTAEKEEGLKSKKGNLFPHYLNDDFTASPQ